MDCRAAIVQDPLNGQVTIRPVGDGPSSCDQAAGVTRVRGLYSRRDHQRHGSSAPSADRILCALRSPPMTEIIGKLCVSNAKAVARLMLSTEHPAATCICRTHHHSNCPSKARSYPSSTKATNAVMDCSESSTLTSSCLHVWHVHGFWDRVVAVTIHLKCRYSCRNLHCLLPGSIRHHSLPFIFTFTWRDGGT